jgi:hypothetical protein
MYTLCSSLQISIKGLTQKTDTSTVKVVVIKNTKYLRKKNRAQPKYLSGYNERAQTLYENKTY